MDISTTASRRASTSSNALPAVNPKYKQIFNGNAQYSPTDRITANTRAITSLKLQNHSRLINSYLFSYGNSQEDNQHFRETFVKFFQYLRGSDPLAITTGGSLVEQFQGYQDVSVKEWSINHTDYGPGYDVSYSPTQEVISELKNIIEDEYGLKEFFLDLLQRNTFSVSNHFKLEDRDTYLREFPLFPRIYPRCADTLKEVFRDILKSEWLQNDINGIKYYLNVNDYVDRPIGDVQRKVESVRLWEIVKKAVQDKLHHDDALNKRFYDELKKDMKSLGISGLVSAGTGNPAFFAGGVGQTIINTLGNYVDPEGKQSDIQLVKVLGGGGLGALLGGNPHDLLTGLSVDLIDLGHRPEKMNKNGATAWNTGTTFLKAIATVDGKKFVAQTF